MKRGNRAGAPQPAAAATPHVKTAPLPDFGTGLRLALEQRGVVTDGRRPFPTLELLLREDEQPEREELFAVRRPDLRLAT